jgi:hypothetical protein
MISKFEDRKGQLFSGDMVMGSIVFIAALAMAFFLWNSVTDDINRSEDLRTMQKKGTEAIDQLIRTPGIPEDWNQFNVDIPGLASDDRIINESKAISFMSLMNSSDSSYDDNKHKLGVAPYEFYLNATDLNGTTLRISGQDFSVGEVPSDESETISFPRTAIFNDTIIRINFILWQ